MSEDIQTYQRFAYKSFRDILSDGFVLFTKNWIKIIGPFALFSIIAIIIQNLLLSDLVWNIILKPNSPNELFNLIYEKIMQDPTSATVEDMQFILQFFVLNLSISALSGIIGSIFTVITMCSISNYLLKTYKGIETSFYNEFKSAFNSKLFIILFFIGILVPLGWFCLFIPGFILLKLHIFSVFTYHNENDKQTLKEARSIAKGQFWKIMAIFLISFSIIGIINNLFYQPFLATFFPANISWYDPITRNYGMIILYDIISNQLFNILLGPLFICFLTVFYTSLKAKKSMLFQFEREPTRVSYPYSESIESKINQFKLPYQKSEHKFESGLYCPYCGKFMEKKLESCPYCNKSLDFEF